MSSSGATFFLERERIRQRCAEVFPQAGLVLEGEGMAPYKGRKHAKAAERNLSRLEKQLRHDNQQLTKVHYHQERTLVRRRGKRRKAMRSLTAEVREELRNTFSNPDVSQIPRQSDIPTFQS